MFGNSRYTTISQADTQSVVVKSHVSIQLFGGFMSFMGLAFTLFCLIDPFFWIMIPAGLLFLLLGLKFLAPYTLTLDLITRRWNERSGMLWWKQQREGSISDLLAVRFTPVGEETPAMLTLEWREGGRTLVMGGNQNMETLARRITEALNLGSKGEQANTLPGQQVWIENSQDAEILQKRDSHALRGQGRGLALFGAVWLAFTLLVGSMLGYSAWVNWQIEAHGRVATGKVLSIERDYSSEGTSYRIRYSFRLPTGQSIEEGVSVSESQLREAFGPDLRSFDVNSPIEVEYLPNNPAYRRLRGFTYNNLSGSPLFGAVMLLLFVGIGVAMIKSGVKMARSEPAVTTGS